MSTTIVKTPYANCAAVGGPEKCRYHSKRFTEHPHANKFASVKDVFLALDENKVKPSIVIKSEGSILEKYAKDNEWRDQVHALDQQLDANQRWVLHKYADSYGSTRVSNTLRNPGIRYEYNDSETHERVLESITVLDDLIEKHSIDTKGITLWRGVSSLKHELTGVKVGSTIQSPTFLSTSQDSTTAVDFTKKEHPVVLKISANSGFPMAAAMHGVEREIVLKRDKKFIVTSIDENVSMETGRGHTREGVTLITLKEV
jgi:hypothetical protein